MRFSLRPLRLAIATSSSLPDDLIRHVVRLSACLRSFWKYVSNLERRESRRYLEMFYNLRLRPLVAKVRGGSCLLQAHYALPADYVSGQSSRVAILFMSLCTRLHCRCQRRLTRNRRPRPRRQSRQDSFSRFRFVYMLSGHKENFIHCVVM